MGVAVAQPSMTEKTERRPSLPMDGAAVIFADRAEKGVQLFSRWAGILAFVGAVTAIAWLIF
ncbi:hypothetical protein [Sphingobium estronivorans]|uniref:hypothetical protein n=1 Tax=Sphingobium estronivorans TaxID=1577690 RepID=UPI0013C372FB|nr:hypothetical protein [Sphingobium estronivorans]